MPVPDFQSLTLPILKLAADGQVHWLKDAVAIMADHFNLSQEERNELLPSRTQTRIYNNVSWAVQYLRSAKLLESPERGAFRVTQRGIEVLNQNPQRIDAQYLKRFQEFKEFFLGKTNQTANGQTEVVESNLPADQVDGERVQGATPSARSGAARPSQELLAALL